MNENIRIILLCSIIKDKIHIFAILKESNAGSCKMALILTLI